MRAVPATRVRAVLRPVVGLVPAGRGDAGGHEVWMDAAGRTCRPVLRKKDVPLGVLFSLARELEAKGLCSGRRFMDALRVLVVVFMFVVGAEAAEYLEVEAFPLSPAGREVFASLPLDPERFYTLTITGTFRVRETRRTQVQRFIFMREEVAVVEHEADAEFVTDAAGNFKDDALDPAFSVPSRVVAADRATHTYTYELEGAGEKLSVALSYDREGFTVSRTALLNVLIERGPLRPYTAITVETVPGFATVTVDGQGGYWRRGRTEIPSTVAAGSATVRVAHAGFITQVLPVRFSRRAPAFVRVELEPVRVPLIERLGVALTTHGPYAVLPLLGVACVAFLYSLLRERRPAMPTPATALPAVRPVRALGEVARAREKTQHRRAGQRPAPESDPNAALAEALEQCGAPDAPGTLKRLRGKFEAGAIDRTEFVRRVQGWPATRKRIATLVESLEIAKEHAPRYGEKTFRRRYGRAYVEKCLAEAGRLCADIQRFHAEDPDVAEYVRLERRDLYEWFFWKSAAVDQAERVAVAVAEAERMPKKRKPTAEEVRGRLVSRVLMGIRDAQELERALADAGITDEDERRGYVERFKRQQAEHHEQKKGDGHVDY